MDDFFQEATDTTPKVSFLATTGELNIEGKSIADDVETFYDPILSWLESYSENPHEKTLLTLKLDYFNISSSKRILFIFYKLNKIVELNKEITVKWFFHEGEDYMYEVGQDFAFMVNIPFEFIEYSEFEPITV